MTSNAPWGRDVEDDDRTWLHRLALRRHTTGGWLVEVWLPLRGVLGKRPQQRFVAKELSEALDAARAAHDQIAALTKVFRLYYNPNYASGQSVCVIYYDSKSELAKRLAMETADAEEVWQAMAVYAMMMEGGGP